MHVRVLYPKWQWPASARRGAGRAAAQPVIVATLDQSADVLLQWAAYRFRWQCRVWIACLSEERQRRGTYGVRGISSSQGGDSFASLGMTMPGEFRPNVDSTLQHISLAFLRF